MKAKKKSSSTATLNVDTANTDIKPFKQMPALNSTVLESIYRINAHDLFSHYTAEIIKEDVVYAR